MRALKWLGGTLMAMALWAAFVVYSTLEGWWETPLAPRDDFSGFISALKAKAEAESRGNLALRVIDGEHMHDHFVSIGEPVNADTLFQVASLSKWVTAWGVLRLVDEGRLDLDAPVATYLKRWSLPASEFDNSGVTIRRLLSHTAGITDGLGYDGFLPGTAIQSLEESLTKAADAEDRDARTRVGLPPGSEWRYSGGSYTLLQLLIEEASGQAFADYMREHVLLPLGMNRSTFVLPPATENLVTVYDESGKTVPIRTYTALAAASLFTTVNDLSRLLAAHTPGKTGEPIGRGVLKPETVQRMREGEGFQFGVPIWGLGTILYVPNDHDDFVIGHDGSNSPAINTTARVDPFTGDGIVVLETGNRLLATELGSDWVIWKHGSLDLLSVVRVTPRMTLVMAIGALMIAIAAFVVYRRRRPSPG